MQSVLLGVLNNEFVVCRVGLLPHRTWPHSLQYVRACSAVGVTAVGANFGNLIYTYTPCPGKKESMVHYA